jgi:hypothetical protein
MTLYRIRYSAYRVEAADAASAKKKVLGLMKNAGDDFFYVEQDASQLPFWKRLLTGK